jgi:multimeric flavodoxin WrbA
MQAIYPAFKEADIVVWASSMFWGYLTSQLKTALDRMEAIVNYFDNKTFVVILTYRRHFETAASFFKRIAPFHNIDLHFITYGSHDFEKNVHIHASKSPEKLKEAFELGQKLNKVIST